MMNSKELEIYIHIPFCVRKCRYCDFLSAPADEKSQDAYMEALCREMAEKSSLYGEYTVSTVFIGGGTPSSVKPQWISRVMDILKQNFKVSEDAEITMEINPGTVDRQSLAVYYAAGINRLSIGLQSAREEELQKLGRIHTYEQFLEAYFTAREIGFSNINVDIMSGLPEQTYEHYMESLERVTSLKPQPEHISAYSLIVEEGTPFFREFEEGRLQLPGEDADRLMYEATGRVLKEHGYERYEISNYAKPGRECRHNVGYWKRENYVGFGIGAASLVENVRFQNETDIHAYIQNPCAESAQKQILSISEQMEETMFLGLRLIKGVSFSEFEKTYGRKLETVYESVIKKHLEEGLLQTEERAGERYVRLTGKGIDVSNYVMADFLEPEFL